MNYAGDWETETNLYLHRSTMIYIEWEMLISITEKFVVALLAAAEQSRCSYHYTGN